MAQSKISLFIFYLILGFISQIQSISNENVSPILFKPNSEAEDFDIFAREVHLEANEKWNMHLEQIREDPRTPVLNDEPTVVTTGEFMTTGEFVTTGEVVTTGEEEMTTVTSGTTSSSSAEVTSSSSSSGASVTSTSSAVTSTTDAFVTTGEDYITTGDIIEEDSTFDTSTSSSSGVEVSSSSSSSSSGSQVTSSTSGSEASPTSSSSSSSSSGKVTSTSTSSTTSRTTGVVVLPPGTKALTLEFAGVLEGFDPEVVYRGISNLLKITPYDPDNFLTMDLRQRTVALKFALVGNAASMMDALIDIAQNDIGAISAATGLSCLGFAVDIVSATSAGTSGVTPVSTASTSASTSASTTAVSNVENGDSLKAGGSNMMIVGIAVGVVVGVVVVVAVIVGIVVMKRKKKYTRVEPA